MSNVLQYKLYCTVAEPLSYSEAKFIDQDVVDFRQRLFLSINDLITFMS